MTTLETLRAISMDMYRIRKQIEGLKKCAAKHHPAVQNRISWLENAYRLNEEDHRKLRESLQLETVCNN